MKFHEYGRENSRIIMLIHGLGWSYWMYSMQAEIWKDKYHIILPVIDGHGEEYNKKYISTENVVDKLIEYIDKSCEGKLFMLAGVSLGGQIILELLNRRPNIAQKVIIESALCIPQIFLKYYSITIYKLIGRNIFSKKTNRVDLKNNKYNFMFPLELYIKDINAIKSDTMINVFKTYYKYSLKEGIKNTKSDLVYWYGGNELKCIKDSAKLVKEFIPQCKIVELKGYSHGELSIYHPCEFVNKANEFLNVN